MLIRPSWVLLSIVLATAMGRADDGTIQILPLEPSAAPKKALPQIHPGGGFKSDVSEGALQPLIESLHSPQFQIRDQATQTLLRQRPERLSELREALARESDPEAATRLTQIAAHLFLKPMTPLQGHASLLGIKLSLELVRPDAESPQDLRMSVAVSELQPGYPAAQELRIGDRLLAIDGKPFPIDMQVQDFRTRVTGRPPGSILQFTLVREGRQMDVGVQLAGLPETAGLQPGTVNMTSIETAIEQRNEALAQFLAGLKHNVKSEPLVVADNSPDAPGYGTINGNGEIRVFVIPNRVPIPVVPIPDDLLPQDQK